MSEHYFRFFGNKKKCRKTNAVSFNPRMYIVLVINSPQNSTFKLELKRNIHCCSGNCALHIAEPLFLDMVGFFNSYVTSYKLVQF